MKSLATRLLVLVGPTLLTACATMNPPLPPSLDLPKPPTDLRASRKGDRVRLTWTIPTSTTDRRTIHSVGSTQICRSVATEITQCGTPVGDLPPQTVASASKAGSKPATASFTDTLPASLLSDVPSATVTYAVQVLNRERRGAGLSNRARVPRIRTLPPPQDFQARLTAQGIVLNWASEAAPQSSEPSIHYIVRVYRNALGSQEERTLVGEVPLGGDHTLTDSSFEWEKTYQYRAQTVTVIQEANKPEVQVEGSDTADQFIFADDVFPPAIPAGLQAAFSGPGQQPFVDLIWAPNTDLDLAGYNVYRHEPGTAPVRLNAELVKTSAYRDTAVVPGKTYLYSISAVDLRGNESARSEEAVESVPQ
jgi:hypothetical protein